MSVSKIITILVLCLAVTGSMAQTAAQSAAIVQACGLASAMVFGASGMKCYKGIPKAKKCDGHCQKVYSAFATSTNPTACGNAVAALGASNAVKAKFTKVRACFS
jgi:hypothetical protein